MSNVFMFIQLLFSTFLTKHYVCNTEKIFFEKKLKMIIKMLNYYQKRKLIFKNVPKISKANILPLLGSRSYNSLLTHDFSYGPGFFHHFVLCITKKTSLTFHIQSSPSIVTPLRTTEWCDYIGVCL